MSLDSRTRSNLNYLKAFAAFLVIFGHGLTYYICYGNPTEAVSVLEHLVYQVHVPLFFVISGFLCHRQPVLPYYKKKVLRVLVPFWFFTALKLVYANFVSDVYAHADSVAGQLYAAFVTGQMYWFAYAIMAVFLAAPLFWEKSESAPPRRAITGFLIFALYNLITSICDISVFPKVFQIASAAKYLPFFLSGLILRRYSTAFRVWFFTHRRIVLPVSLAVAAASACTFAFGVDLGYSMDVLAAYALMAPLLLLANRIPENDRILTYAGNRSYQSMLLDPFFKVVLFYAAGRLCGLSMLVVLCAAAADSLLGLLACRIAERIPVVRTLFGLSRPQT